jgi:hypothetical protein
MRVMGHYGRRFRLALVCLGLLAAMLVTNMHNNLELPTFAPPLFFVPESTFMIKQAQLCLHERGHDGWWVQDWDYASTAQYGNMPVTNKSELFRAHRNFVSTEEQPYRWATSWRWVDETCAVQLVALEGFCRVCHDLNISLVYVLGDSLQAAFSTSLRGLLGFPLMAGNLPLLLVPLTVPCPDPYSDVLHVHRKWNADKDLRDLDHPELLYSNRNRTLTLLNLGVHMHSMEIFKRTFDSLLGWVDGLNRTDDLVFLRNSPPGHLRCEPRADRRTYNWTIPLKVTPFQNYSQYKLTETTKYGWNLMEQYNKHAEKVIEARSTEASRVRVWLLNVFNSTVLRRDGHLGGSDCLHYSMPGPTDWWVHMLYSSLLDLSAQRITL